MNRFVPRSLFSRLVLVLLAGVVLAQAAGLAIYWRDRDEFMQRAFGLRSVQRVADVIRVLDDMAPAERQRVVGILNSPQLRITLDMGPIASAVHASTSSARTEDTGSKSLARGESPVRPELVEGRAQNLLSEADEAQRFAAALRRVLGDERELTVHVTDAPFIKGPPPGYGPGKGGMMGAGMGMGPGAGGYPFGAVSFVVQARLKDGVLATLDARQSRDAGAWSYRLMASLAIVLVAVLVVAFIAVRWVTRPLKALAHAAEELGENIDRPPLDESGPLEVSRAARAFNAMQQRLSRHIAERASIFAAMSHDLKTPITRLRLRAELLDDAELRGKIERDLHEMEQMVSGALDLVRGLDRKEPMQPFDVMALLETIRENAALAGTSVEIAGTTSKPYCGRMQSIRRCLVNLIENATKYGGRAWVIVRDDAQRLEIVVRDSGPGIPESELERVFEPFYRLERSRNRETGGTGLGLSIARAIARAHGGDVVLRNRPEGGLEATLSLSRDLHEHTADATDCG
jgi:signal transduction histidine kinase